MQDDDEREVVRDAPPEPGTFEIGLEGRWWNIDRFLAIEPLLPEKLELSHGKLFWSRRERLAMLSAMLEQVGLVEAVKLAPKERWLEALRQAYD